MAKIQSSGGAGEGLVIGPSSNAAYCEIRDSSQNKLANLHRGTVSEAAAGLMQGGKDYKFSRTLRAGSTGSLQIGGDDTILLSDSFEGTTRNLMQWVETLTTMTTAQTAAVGLTLNNGAITTINTGALESSHMQFRVAPRTGLVFRIRCRVTAVANQVVEFGFGDTSSATTAQVNNGAFFRLDSSNVWRSVCSFNGADITSPSFTSPATTDYNTYEVWLEDSHVTFQVWSSAGTLLMAATAEIPATQARNFTLTHISCFIRIYNTGSAPASGGQIIVNQASVQLVDAWSQRDHRVQQSGLGLNSTVSPTAYTQLANYANSAAPTSATLSNTAAGYTTLGGQYQFASIAGAETDYALFGWQNPSPYMFYCTGIRVGEMVNTVVAVATTASIFQWGAAFNSSAVSLATAAPYSPMRVQLGTQAFIVAAAVGATAPAIAWTPGTPIAVFPGRFLHVIVKEPVGTATATEIYRGSVAVDGFFE